MLNLHKLFTYLFDNVLIFSSNNQLHVYNANRYDLDANRYDLDANLEALEAGYLHLIEPSYLCLLKNHNYNLKSLEEGYRINIEEI